MANNKRIVKNAFFLYIRMFITMGISLFTSRVILNTLGETDFGIYNIVGGIVILFSFLNAALTTATQRYLSYALGKKDDQIFSTYFSISTTCYIVLSIILFILTETIGLWFLNTYLNIPDNRMSAANIVYQFSILSFIAQILRIPYHSTVIAYEKMDFFAVMSIIEAILKLFIVYVLLVITLDKLTLYSLLMFCVILIITIVYKAYCNHKYDNTFYKFIYDKVKLREFLSFSTWSLFGGIANIGSQQALNFMLNIFFGVKVNAAVGIANQVTGAVYSFVTNFQTAFNPQIIKNYAMKDYNAYQRLVFMASKISFFLLFTIGLPIIVNIKYILQLWLDNVPNYTAQFVSVIFIYQLIDAVSMPFLTCIQARGVIRNYQIIISLLILANIPLAYIVLKLGGDPYMIWFTKIVVNIVCFSYRCFYVNKNVKINIRDFFKSVLFRVLLIMLICIPINFLGKQYFPDNFMSILVYAIFSIIFSITVIYLIGLNKLEKQIINERLHLILKHDHH